MQRPQPALPLFHDLQRILTRNAGPEHVQFQQDKFRIQPFPENFNWPQPRTPREFEGVVVVRQLHAGLAAEFARPVHSVCRSAVKIFAVAARARVDIADHKVFHPGLFQA